MAWLSLVIVTLIFFTPSFGIGPQVAARDMALNIHLPLVTMAIPIPFTGPLRLFLYSGGAWAVLWLVPYLIDKFLGEKALREPLEYEAQVSQGKKNKGYIDFLSRIRLWNDLVNAFRPEFSGQLAVRLAKILVWFMVIKAIVVYLLRAALNTLVPLLTTWLTAQFGALFISQLKDGLSQGLATLLGLRADNSVVLVVFCILVLIANRAFQVEQRYRYDYAVQKHQREIKKSQAEIVVSATQL